MPNIAEMTTSSFFSGAALAAEGKAHLLTVDRVAQEDLGNNEMKWVVYFRETDKGVVLNTNAKLRRFAETMESMETDDWLGNKVVIGAGKTTFQGKSVNCVAWRKPKADEPAAAPAADEFSDDDIPF